MQLLAWKYLQSVMWLGSILLLLIFILFLLKGSLQVNYPGRADWLRLNIVELNWSVYQLFVLWYMRILENEILPKPMIRGMAQNKHVMFSAETLMNPSAFLRGCLQELG